MEWLTAAICLGVLAMALAYAFEFVNGFHDTANAVSTVIYSGALKARTAILMCAVLNFLGAITVGTGVAQFITKVVPAEVVSIKLILAVLMGGLLWNLFTWYKGIPVSSSHCLLGSLAGAGIAAAGLQGINPTKLIEAAKALAISPLAGFAIACALAWLSKKLLALLYADKPELVSGKERSKHPNQWFRYLQILSSAAVSFSHGANDGQKMMGIMTLILATSFAAFGYTVNVVPFWVMLTAAAAIGIGTAIGGWRIIETVGERLSNKGIDPVHGCAAEFTTAATVFGASYAGIPVSTTHVLNMSVIGATYGLHGPGHTNMTTMKKIINAWLLTLPVTALTAMITFMVLGLWL